MNRATTLTIAGGVKSLALVFLAAALSACSAMHTAVAKRNLDVQTHMSSTIYLDPVEPEQKTVYLDVRNTSAKADFDVRQDMVQALNKRGYQVLDSPTDAHYWLQINVRSVLKMPPTEALSEALGAHVDELSDQEYDALLNRPLPTDVQDDDRPYNGNDTHVNFGVGYSGNISKRDAEKIIAAVVVIAVAETVGNALVKDVYYSVITDVQISEKIDTGTVQEDSHHDLVQGSSGDTESTFHRETQRKQYQTHVLSFANQVNLDWEDAREALRVRLARSLSGLF